MSKKFKTHCKLIDYIAQKDSEFAELLRGTCADLTLQSFRGKGGITVLIPAKDAPIRKKIADLAYSDNVDDASKAGDMLNAMIFRDVYKTGTDWSNNKNNIPNSLIPPQHVAIKTTTSSTVEFASGAKAKLDTDFRDSSRRKNLAVWILESGEIPVTTDKPAQFVPQKRAPIKGSKKEGSYEPSDELAATLRFRIAIAVENIYMADRVNHSHGAEVFGGCDHNITSSARDIFCEYTMSLVNHVMNVRNDYELLYDKILPLISYQKIDFYNLIEPHRAKGHLIPDDCILDWWNNRATVNLKTVMGQVHDAMSQLPPNVEATKAAIYRSPRKVIEAVNDCRTKIISETVAKETALAVEKTYGELEKDNKIGDLHDVLPPGLYYHYKTNPGLKLLQDELRYLTFLMFEQLELEEFNRAQYEKIINMIADYTHVEDARARDATRTLTNSTTLKYLIMPTERIQAIQGFVGTTLFLHAPTTRELCANYPFKSVIKRPPAKSDIDVVWNIDLRQFKHHTRLASGNDAVAAIIRKLREVDPRAIDPAVRNELISIYSKISS